MRRATFFRAEYAARNAVAHALQSFQRPSDAKSSVWHKTGKQAFDVFNEDAARTHLLESDKPVIKDKSFIGSTFTESGVAMGLARDSRSRDIHQSSKFCVWEGEQVRPDRCRIQSSLFNFCSQICDGECFPLAVSDCA
jgi:hypothetical protein